MAAQRQQNWQGQQRIDLPHLRAVESGVAYDFDLLAGEILAGRLPVVVQGFEVLTAGAVGADAEALVVKTAEGIVIHYEASEAGSIHRVPADRADEVLAPTNARVLGSFTPGATNFVGLDLVRLSDDSTADVVQFLTPSTNEETAQTVALARSMDYRIVVSTQEFSATPGICPIAKVVTNLQNKVVTITDARWLLFRLGAGGSAVSAVSPYAWPGGRDEDVSSLSTVAGDRSLNNLKDWLNAAMTRLWELGGGEFWYSPTADRNVNFGGVGVVFTSTGEPFEYVGGHLHWKDLRFVFDNSKAAVNEVLAQNTDVAGLTDLAAGECLYVDLDRSADRTVALTNPLIAKKGPLKTLGGSDVPGNRYVLAWRPGAAAEVYIRNQPYPVGGSLKLGTTLSAGAVKTSVNPDTGTWVPTQPVAALLAMVGAASYSVTGGGLSHNTDVGSGHLVAAGDLVIGRGTSAGDHNVFLTTDGNLYETRIRGTSSFAAASKAALKVEQLSGDPDDHVLHAGGDNGADTGEALVVEVGGAVHLRPAVIQPLPPAPSAAFPARSKLYSRPTKNFGTAVTLATDVGLAAYTPAGSGVGKTLTANANGALTVDGSGVSVGNRILVKNEAGANRVHNGVYVVTATGDGSNPFVLTRATDADQTLDWQENLTFYVNSGSVNGDTYWKADNGRVVVDTDLITFTITDSDRRDEVVVMWHDGSVSVLAQSPSY